MTKLTQYLSVAWGREGAIAEGLVEGLPVLGWRADRTQAYRTFKLEYTHLHI